MRPGFVMRDDYYYASSCCCSILVQELKQLLQDLVTTASASEVHGFVTGLLAAGFRLNKQQLIKF